MAGKGNFFQRMIRKAAPNYFVTVVNTKNTQGWDVFNTNGQLTNDQLISNFETIPQLYAITDYVASKIAHIPVKVVKPSGKLAVNSELHKLIAEPNHYQSWNELIKLFFAYYEMSGNGFAYGLKPDGMDMVTSMYCLPVEKTEVVLRYDKSLPAWMNEVEGYRVNIGGNYYNLPAEMVFHERYITLRYNDGSWVYGMSKYIPGDKINKELKAIHNAKTSIIEERGAVGFITNESEIPDEENTKAVKDKLKSSTGYGLLSEQDKIIVTTEKLRWQQMALGISELQLIENAKYSFSTLCQINGFDPVIFSTEGSSYANKATAEKQMMLKVIKPKVDNFYKNLSIFLGSGYNGDMIVPDWSQVEEMQADKKETTELLSRQVECMFITPKEGREILYPDMETGEEEPPDTFYRRTSLVPAMQEETVPGAELPGDIDPEMIRQLFEDRQRNGGEDGD